MIISIASGKGGTGKTTVATNLAVCMDTEVQLLDCDVEEPNAHLAARNVVRNIEIIALRSSYKPTFHHRFQPDNLIVGSGNYLTLCLQSLFF